MLNVSVNAVCIFLQAEDEIRDLTVTGVQTCALPIYVSGRHGSVYIDHHAIYTVLKAVSQMCRFMAEDIYDLSLGCEIEVVLGPEGGGIILSRFLKEHLDRFGGKRISLWAKKQYGDNGLRKFVLPRAFIKHISGKKVFLIDDILTSGSTFYELTELANR